MAHSMTQSCVGWKLHQSEHKSKVQKGASGLERERMMCHSMLRRFSGMNRAAPSSHEGGRVRRGEGLREMGAMFRHDRFSSTWKPSLDMSMFSAGVFTVTCIARCSQA